MPYLYADLWGEQPEQPDCPHCNDERVIDDGSGQSGPDYEPARACYVPCPYCDRDDRDPDEGAETREGSDR